jgi:hypothetical protein
MFGGYRAGLAGVCPPHLLVGFGCQPSVNVHRLGLSARRPQWNHQLSSLSIFAKDASIKTCELCHFPHGGEGNLKSTIFQTFYTDPTKD